MRNGVLNNGLKSRIFITACYCRDVINHVSTITTIIEIMIKSVNTPNPLGLGWDINGLQPFYYVPKAQHNSAQWQRLG